MGLVIRILSIALALTSSVIIVRSVRRRRLTLGFAVTWLMVAVVITAIGLGGDRILDPLARDIGVTYPPALLFLVANVVLLLICAYLSSQVADLQRQIDDVVDRYGRDHVREPPSSSDDGLASEPAVAGAHPLDE